MRLFSSLLFLVAGIIIGAFMHAYLFGNGASKPAPEIKQEILLERIKQVAKLITVEGEFSNVHQYKDVGSWGIGLTTKKAILRVKARASVGYDLKKMTWEVDSLNKIIRVRDLPEPEILAIDHDVEYYDIQEAMFNSFNEEELTNINVVIKKRLRSNIEKGDLMEKARQEGISNLVIIKLLVEQAGWKFEVISNQIDDPDLIPSDSLKNIKIPNSKQKIDSLLN